MTDREISRVLGTCVVVAEKSDRATAAAINGAFDAICELRKRIRELHARLVLQARVLEAAELERDRGGTA